MKRPTESLYTRARRTTAAPGTGNAIHMNRLSHRNPRAKWVCGFRLTWEGIVTKNETLKFHARLQELADRIETTAGTAEDEARQPKEGEVGGDPTGAPIHLGDAESEVATQEVEATLLANEQYLRDEIRAALDRLDKGTFGQCEHCGRAIARPRLAAVPYARFCMTCAASQHDASTTSPGSGQFAKSEE